MSANWPAKIVVFSETLPFFFVSEPRSADLTIDTDLGDHLEMQVIQGEHISEYKPLYINHFFPFLFPVIQNGVEGGKSAMDLFGSGPASPAASWEQDAFSAFLRDPGIGGIDFRVCQDIPDRP